MTKLFDQLHSVGVLISSCFYWNVEQFIVSMWVNRRRYRSRSVPAVIAL